MYPRIIYFLIIILCWILPSGCSEENKPDNPVPELTISEAQDITRTGATLTGTVNTPSGSFTDRYHFRYGTSSKMEQSCKCLPENSIATVTLENLIPGTTYYYCLEAGNNKYLVQSPVLSFTTIPNEVPKIEEITFMGQGPISIMLQCAVSDNGGEEITASGFCYAAENGREQEITSPLPGNEQWCLRIRDLEENVAYTVRAFAENKIGRTYSEPYHFRTGQAVILTTAGTLPEIMDEEEKYGYTELSIAGPLNGTDIRFIREMKLSVLDLTDASIIAGGLSYNEGRYTQDNVIGYGMFSELDILKSLRLPEKTRIIEKDAFKNSTSLTELSIPENTETIVPSTGCIQLNKISIVSANRFLSSVNGVVYDKNGETLIWFPEGITGDDILFPSTLKSLGDYALQKCKIRNIVLPNSLTSLGKQVFYGSEIESVVLPDNLKTIPYGLFQECKNLTSVTLGSNSELISDYCFDGCPLQHLYVKASYPPVCSPDAFTGAENIFGNCILHVPAESRSLYKNANVWKQFLRVDSFSDGE